jgi:hypothetical protein
LYGHAFPDYCQHVTSVFTLSKFITPDDLLKSLGPDSGIAKAPYRFNDFLCLEVQAKIGLESLGAQVVYCSKTLRLHDFKRREIVHCKTDRGRQENIQDLTLLKTGQHSGRTMIRCFLTDSLSLSRHHGSELNSPYVRHRCLVFAQ